VLEQRIWFSDGGQLYDLRRVVLRLDEPTREGETEIVLLTNLPADVYAQTVAEAYRNGATFGSDRMFRPFACFRHARA
jgi:hypothetical protein